MYLVIITLQYILYCLHYDEKYSSYIGTKLAIRLRLGRKLDLESKSLTVVPRYEINMAYY